MLTDPILNQNLDGNGQFFAQHVYTSDGEKTVEVCVEDNVVIIAGGACTLAIDQRGIVRPSDEGCDIGAVEMQESELVDSGPGTGDNTVYLPTVSR